MLINSVSAPPPHAPSFSPTAIAVFPQSSCRYFCYDLTDTFTGEKVEGGGRVGQPDRAACVGVKK